MVGKLAMNSFPFMEPESSLQLSQDLSSDAYSEAVESNPHYPTPFP
jgi:hypothetical protein